MAFRFVFMFWVGVVSWHALQMEDDTASIPFSHDTGPKCPPKIEFVDTDEGSMEFPSDSQECLCLESPITINCVCNQYCTDQETEVQCLQLLGPLEYSFQGGGDDMCVPKGTNFLFTYSHKVCT